MAALGVWGDVKATLGDDHVAVVRIHRPPNNFFDQALIGSLAEAFEALDAAADCRVALLCSEGKHFCAGANLGTRESATEDTRGRHLYDDAVRLFASRTPSVAVVQGAAVGGGLGLALFSDFRVCAPEARFAANFARLGFHHGFGLSVTLPRLVGQQRAMELLYTGRRVPGEEAHALGLADRVAPLDRLEEEARALAREIAASAPLAIDSIRETLRGGLAEEIRRATDREKAEQQRLQNTEDFREGIRASAERRTPRFRGL